MAVVDFGTAHTLDTAADTLSGTIIVRAIHVATGATASVSSGTVVTIRDDTAADILLVPLAAESSYTITFGGKGWKVTGFELDATPANTLVTVFEA